MSHKVDYLIEDEPIPGQSYLVLSVLSPGFNKNVKEDVRGIKFRGAYATYEEAMERSKYLQEVDPAHNVFVGEVGKWLPFVDDPDKAKDSQYAEAQLQKLMKTYLENQTKAKQMYEMRKNEMMMEAMKKDMNKKAKTTKNRTKKLKKKNQEQTSLNDENKKMLNESEISVDLESLPSLKKPEDKTNLSESSGSSSSSSSSGEMTENECDENKLADIEKELENAKQLLNALTNKNTSYETNKETIDDLREIATEMHEIAANKMAEREKE